MPLSSQPLLGAPQIANPSYDPTSGMLQPRHGDYENHTELMASKWLGQSQSKFTVEEGPALVLLNDPSESGQCISLQPSKTRCQLLDEEQRVGNEVGGNPVK